MTINKFDVLKIMGERNMDIRGFPLTNITHINTGKELGHVTISVNKQTATELMAGRSLVGMLLIANADQFDQVKTELEKQEVQP